MRMYAERKKWPLQDIKIDLTHNRTYIKDCETCELDKGQLDTLSRKIELIGDLSDEQKQALLVISEKCPVHKTLHSKLVVTTELKNWINPVYDLGWWQEFRFKYVYLPILNYLSVIYL